MNNTTSEIIISSGSISGTSLMTNMVIFNDPIYLFISFLSTMVGIATALNDLKVREELKSVSHPYFIIFKGGLIGAISAPAMMLVLLAFGEQLIAKNGFIVDENFKQVLVSFYFLISLLLSRLIALKIIYIIEKKGKENG